MSASNEKLAAINGLRGLAIIGTVFHHSFYTQFAYGSGASAAPAWLNLLASSGWMGVNLFFFLSGFVLYLPYASGERSMQAPGAYGQFYKRRAKRLLPLYTLVWLLSLIFVAGYKIDSASFLGGLFLYGFVYFPFTPMTFFPPGNWVLWSVGVEIWFSALFPVTVDGLKRLRWPLFLLLSTAASCGVRWFGHHVTPPSTEILNYISDSVLGRLDEFAWGMFAAHLFTTQQKQSYGVGAAIAGAALVIAAMLIWWFTMHQVVGNVARTFANPIFSLGVLLITMHALDARRLLSRALAVWPLQLLGLMCYSIYVWHGIVMLKFGGSIHSNAAAYAGYLASTLGLAWLTYRYVEFGYVKNWRDLLPRRRLAGAAAAHPTSARAAAAGTAPRTIA